MDVSIAAALIAVAFGAGIVLGARGRMMMSLAMGAAASLLRFRIPVPNADEGGGKDEEEGGEGGQVVDKTMLHVERGLDQFLVTDATPFFDEHPNLELNPVLLYLIKKANDSEKARRMLEQRLSTLLAEGYSPQEAMQQLREEAKVIGRGNAAPEKRSIQVLIEHGARLKPVENADGVDAKVAQLKRNQRSISLYLAKSRSVEAAAAAASGGGGEATAPTTRLARALPGGGGSSKTREPCRGLADVSRGRSAPSPRPRRTWR